MDNYEKTPLISVIVPIYNVERYARKCLDSLKGQTLKQIEVIMIDDGSTDGSGLIADEYVSEDWPRFRIIHTENRGLSAARNRGVDDSKAQWLMFVDSDDWVDPEFCELPYETALEYGADMVIFGLYEAKRNGIIRETQNTGFPVGIVDEMTAHEYGGEVSWNKLYKKTLFNITKFPEGHVHEDLATTHIFVNRASKIVMLHNRLYYHFDRKGRICHTHTNAFMRDAFIAALDRYEFLSGHGYPLEKIDSLPQRYAIRYLASTRTEKDAIYLRAQEIVNGIQNTPKEFTVRQKIAFLAWKIDERLFYLLCKMSGRIKE